MFDLPGTPSDELPDVRAIGTTDVSTVFVAMARRHPEGRDEEYLRWHALDHRPEQYRLSGLRLGLRLVSTPECRASRAVTGTRFDEVDHVTNYFLTDSAAIPAFRRLGEALRGAGRCPPRLPPLLFAIGDMVGKVAAPAAVVGADVVPWRPMRGVYVLVEEGSASPAELVELPGAIGAWWYQGTKPAPPYDARAHEMDTTGIQITHCFLDGDPVDFAHRVRDVLEARWADSGLTPLLAAPFFVPIDFDWARYVP